MEAPRERLTLQGFNAEITNYFAEHCEKTESGYKCKKCEAVIQQTTLWVSIHTTLFEECAGYGEVKRFPLPYCPRCEGEPKKISTCVHLAPSEAELQLLGINS